MSALIYQVTHLPDLEKTEHRAKYGDDPASQLYEMQDNFLYTLHTIAHQFPLECSLVYKYNPDDSNEDKKLQIFVRLHFQSDLSPDNLEEIKIIFDNSFWKDFYKTEDVTNSFQLNTKWANHISFGIKQEEEIKPIIKRNNTPSYYYLIHPFEPVDEVDRVTLCSKLEAYQNKALVEIVIKPTFLKRKEEEALENVLQVLGSQTSYEIKTSEISGKTIEQPIDPIAERVLRQFEDLREEIQSQPLFEFSIRVLGENKFKANLLLNEFWVESSQKPLYRKIGIDRKEPKFTEAIKAIEEGTLFPQAVWNDFWNEDRENSPLKNPLKNLIRLHRLFTIEEATPCFRVVVPDSAVVFSGIRKETDLKTNKSDDDYILLGWQAGKLKNQAQVPLKNFNKHVFICGVPGSGKTTAVLNLLFQLWTEHKIPFLVIEPAKTEYRSMLRCKYQQEKIDEDENQTTKAYAEARNVPEAIASMEEDLQVFSLGNEQVCPFRFNPFVFYGTTTLDEHISTLEACFKAAMPLFGPLPALLSEAIEQVYAQLGWQPQDTADSGLEEGFEFPNMQELYETINAVFETKEYSSDVKGDIKTALEVRIGGLLRRSVGSMLNTRESFPDIGSLLEKPVILEMDSLNEEQANLMTMFVLATLRQYARVTRKSGSPLKHVVVIEEAHNIVGTDAPAGEEGSTSPKAEATKYVVRMLAEMRALGQGIIIADQLPTAISPEVIKNTNVKLAHRIVSGDDREILQQSMLLTGTQSEEVARAMPGDAYLFMEGTYKPVRIKEPDTKLIYGIEEPPSNEELRECIGNKGFYQQVQIAKNYLHQQKVDKYLKEAIFELEEYLQDIKKSYFDTENTLESMKQKVEQSISTEEIAVIYENIEEAIKDLDKVIEAVSIKIKWFSTDSRTKGIYYELHDNDIIQSIIEKIYEQKDKFCQAKIEFIAILEILNFINPKFESQLEKIYSKCLNYFNICEQKANILIEAMKNNHDQTDILNADYYQNQEKIESELKKIGEIIEKSKQLLNVSNYANKNQYMQNLDNIGNEVTNKQNEILMQEDEIESVYQSFH